MSQTPATLAEPADDPAEVLTAVRAARVAADREEARILALAVDWAAMHSPDSLADAATWSDSAFGDRPVPVGGPGAPLVSEFSVAELAAALGLPTEVGKSLLGEAVELRHRLPRVWTCVQAGDLPAWRARRIARATLCLAPDAAAFVDDRVASFAHRVGPAVVDRLVEEAVVRFMPDSAEARRRAAADRRHVTVHDRQVSFDGTVFVEAELDLADALDLDTALTDGAAQLAALGSTDHLDVRRAIALGELARGERALELPDETRARPGRRLVLHVHLSDEAVTGSGDAPSLGRVESTRSFVSAEQVRAWCAAPGAQITVRPVIDLRETIRVDAYEVPERLVEQVVLRDGTCVFPWCTRSARACDLDHVEPYGEGGGTGQTSSDNLAPLCRRHHRLKTFGGWHYRAIGPGAFEWSPHGHAYFFDQRGTTHRGTEP